jgi:hypothetical protein
MDGIRHMRGSALFAFAPRWLQRGISRNLVAHSDVVGRTWHLVSLQDGSADPIVVSDTERYTLRLGH